MLRVIWNGCNEFPIFEHLFNLFFGQICKQQICQEHSLCSPSTKCAYRKHIQILKIHIYVDPNNVKLIFPLSQYLIIFFLYNMNIYVGKKPQIKIEEKLSLHKKKHAVILAWSPCSCINWLLFLALNFLTYHLIFTLEMNNWWW